MNTIEKCEVCGNLKMKTVLNLGMHPMCDDLIEVGNERSCREYPIEVLFCTECYTAHQKYQIPKEELFPDDYHYRAHFTADVLNGMKELVNSCKEKYGDLKNKRVIDIGCNDGSLLDFFSDEGCRTIGIEPTYAYKEASEKGHKVYNKFFDTSISKSIVEEYGYPDFITFTNVFAHIENLPELLKALKLLAGENSVIIIENHYLGSILKNNQFDTFYHEHPRTYSFKSFEFIAKAMNMKIEDVEFPARYGGNIRVYISHNQENKIKKQEILEEESEFEELFKRLENGIKIWKDNKNNEIRHYVQKYGKLKAKAFPGRAAILMKILGINENVIEAVYEKAGSKKIGNYVPGTHIPIVSDEVLFDEGNNDKPIINLAWHIPDEIRAYLKENGYKGNVIDILTKDELDKI